MHDTKKSFGHIYRMMFFSPGMAMDQISRSEKKLKYSMYAFLIPAIGYTLFYMMAWKAGGSPTTFKPWLNLPIERYFYYDIFLCLPGYFMALVTASSIAYLFSKSMGGKGTWDNQFAMTSFTMGVVTWSTMFHDLSDAILGFAGILDMKHYERLLNQPTFWRFLLLSLYLVYLCWFVFLFTLAVRRNHKLKMLPALLIGLLTFVFYQGTLFIFIR